MNPGRTWCVRGALMGACIALVAQAPATWLAQAVGRASQQRVVLHNPQGTVWQGSASALLSDGSGQGVVLASRLQWNFSPGFDTSTARFVVRAQLHSDCCTPDPLRLALSLGWQGLRISLANQHSQWPASWLVGLGAPWNTVQPDGQMQVRTENFVWHSHVRTAAMQGLVELTLTQLSTPLSTLRPLGTYRLRLEGGDTMSVALSTVDGGLQLSGKGQWVDGRLRFKGEARAQPDFEAALSNLLNILGQRQGTISIMELG